MSFIGLGTSTSRGSGWQTAPLEADKVLGAPSRIKGRAPFFFPIFVPPPCVGGRGGRRRRRGRWRGLPLGRKPPLSQQIILIYYWPWVPWSFTKVGSSYYRGRPHTRLYVGHHLAALCVPKHLARVCWLWSVAMKVGEAPLVSLCGTSDPVAPHHACQIIYLARVCWL